MDSSNLPGIESLDEMVVEIDEDFWNACMGVLVAYVQDYSWETDMRRAVGKLVDLGVDDPLQVISIKRVRRVSNPAPEAPRVKRKIMLRRPKPKPKR